jgi:hypothetical protein
MNERLDEIALDTAKPFDFETYMKGQTNYIAELRQDAILNGDFDYKTTPTEFTMHRTKGYFAKGYDLAWRQYYCGLRHKPKWGEL